MAVWTSYRTARTCWLREGGELLDVEGASADPRRARLIALSRGLCRFEFYAPPPGMSGRGALRAARLRAEAFAPFTAADSVLLRAREGVAIWWWDGDRTAALLEAVGIAYDPERLVPETLLQAPAEGWRQVRCADGYEAQYWRAGALRAAAWRRRPFSAEQWAAFAQTLDAP
ncbi:hypothetical protein, partial [Caulobacter sp. 17J65-9]|uniref:hypothetical protein n=1 Tax=Caulobacter sp. 17J65-9 TaxID=2709382 RepID=UPI0013C7489C